MAGERPRAERPAEREPELLPGLNSVPGVVRVAAGAWFRGATWGVGAGLRAAERAGDLSLTALGLAGGAGAEVADGVAEAAKASATRPRESEREREREREERDERRTLRERGGELLERAADVDDGDDPVHPGFARIIDQLAPDEARILKLLINEG